MHSPSRYCCTSSCLSMPHSPSFFSSSPSWAIFSGERPSGRNPTLHLPLPSKPSTMNNPLLNDPQPDNPLPTDPGPGHQPLPSTPSAHPHPDLPVPHPSGLIPADQADKLRSFSADAESSGSLHPGQLAIIDEQRWFNLYVPRSHGGLELSLPEGLRMEEALAWTDGSLGWTVTLCSGANWFIGFLQPEIAKDLFSDRRSCFAGSGRASGIARITATGYEVTGRWKYASGAPHATAFTANCLLEKDGALLQNEDGSPMMRAFLFLKDEVIVHKDWNAMGMIATASHSFEVRQQQVGRDRCFTIDSHHSFLPQPIYRYPFLQLAETTLAVNSAGMAAHFIDLCEGIFARRSDHAGNKPRMGAATARLAEAKIVLQYLRQSFYRA